MQISHQKLDLCLPENILKTCDEFHTAGNTEEEQLREKERGERRGKRERERVRVGGNKSRCKEC